MTLAIQNSTIVNGIDTDRVKYLAGNMIDDDNYAQFKWRALNHWLGGSRSRTVIQDFFAGGKENTERSHFLSVDADQPKFLAGHNTAPNAVEYILHALTSCLSTTLVYHASVHEIPLENVIVSADGHMNAKGFFGISDDVKRGYESIDVTMQVKSSADIDTLTKLAMYSPVYEMISNSVEVNFKIQKI